MGLIDIAGMSNVVSLYPPAGQSEIVVLCMFYFYDRIFLKCKIAIVKDIT
jgi:hypothetical protein